MMSSTNLSAILNDTLYIEDFASDDEDDWSGAIQRCIDTAIASKIPKIRGGNVYSISSGITICYANNYGLDIDIAGLSVTSAWKKNTCLWDADPILLIGDNVSNIVNMSIRIGIIDGGGCADGVSINGFGYALSEIDLGFVSNCITVVKSGTQEWPNASLQIRGKYWVNNWLGVYLAANPSGETAGPPIVEGWKIKVLFCAANRLTGYWFRNAGQYAQVEGDLDYNGKYLTIIQAGSTTDFDEVKKLQQLRAIGVNSSAEYVTHYSYQGQLYLVFFEDNDVSVGSGNIPFAAEGDNITFAGFNNVQVNVSKVINAADNPSATNFFDIIHDFSNSPFGKISVQCGYLSEIIGDGLHTSAINYHNSYNPLTNIVNGFCIGNSGSLMSLYDLAQSDKPFATISSEFFHVDKRLYLQDHKISGITTASYIPQANANQDFYDLLSFNDTAIDKYENEGSDWLINITTNFVGIRASMTVSTWGINGIMVSDEKLSGEAVFEYRFVETFDTDGQTVTGVNLQVRQTPQPFMFFSVTKTRKG